jgi:formyltetrahydrofolate deformylase
VTSSPGNDVVLRFRCADRPGIIAAVTPPLAAAGWDIRDAGIFGDAATGAFFVRMHIASKTAAFEDIERVLGPATRSFGLTLEAFDLRLPLRTLIAVSKSEHCLVDLIHKTKIGTLPIEIAGVVSNHDAARATCEWHGLAFHRIPMDAANKSVQEDAFRALIADTGAELVVLARYMQILSSDFASLLAGRCINIHHSFLPSFKGARPYAQAHDRGVKLIGANAHYVTADLDEGPIIEQDVRRVTHATTEEEMIAIGREVEASVLSRAVRWHAEHRVMLNGHKTVVFEQ